MVPLLIAGAGIQAIGSFMGYKSKKKAAKAAKRLMYANAAARKKEDEERIRRTGIDFAWNEGKTALNVNASGFKEGSSLHRVRDTYKSENRYQMDWLIAAKERNYQLALQGADARYRTSMDIRRAQGIGAIGSTIGSVGNILSANAASAALPKGGTT